MGNGKAIAHGSRWWARFALPTVQSLMTTEFVGVPSTWTVGETLQYVRRVESTRETVYAIYVLDPKTKALVRAISLRRLITGEPQQQVLSICPPRRPLTVSPLADREDVARLISKYDLLAVPVVDKTGHVLGIVTVDDVIDAMIEESTEDVCRNSAAWRPWRLLTWRSASWK